MEAKPICLIRYLEQETGVKYYQIQEILEKRFSDYHVLVIPTRNQEIDIFSIEVFNDKDYTEIQHEELKKIIVEELQKFKNP